MDDRINIRRVEFAFLMLFIFVMWSVHQPGVFAYDSILTWYEGHIKYFSSGQPATLGFIWNFFDNITGHGASALILLSCSSISLGIYLIIRHIAPPRYAFVALAVISYFPPIFSHISIIDKESLATNLLILSFGVAIHVRPYKMGWIAPMFAALSVMIRYQYVIALLIGMAGIIIHKNKMANAGRFLFSEFCWRFLYFFGMTSVFCLFIFSTISITTDVDWRAPIDVNVRYRAIYDLAALVSHNRDTPLRILEKFGLNAKLIDDTFANAYTPRSNIPTLNNINTLGLDAIPTNAILEQVSTLAAVNPGVLTHHRIAAFWNLLGMDEVCWPIQSKIARPDPDSVEGKRASAVGLENLPESLASRLILNAGWFPANTVLFRPIIYLCLSVGGLTWLCLGTERRKMYIWLMGLLASGIVYTISFIPVTPSCDFRYLYWPVATSVICISIIVRLINAEKAVRST